MNRILISLLLAASLLAAGLGWYTKSQIARVSSLTAENTRLTEQANRAAVALKTSRAALRARESQLVSQAHKLAAAQASLSEALRANKQWSDTDVPIDVQKALGGLPASVPDGLQNHGTGASYHTE